MRVVHNREIDMTHEEARKKLAILLQHSAHPTSDANSTMSNETREGINECMKVLDPAFNPNIAVKRVVE